MGVGEKMSSAAESETTDAMMFCANCGTAGNDGVKLKKCTACHLVRYCSVKCQKDHRPKHKKECKKRAAELKDEILFKQPEGTHLGDCPICCLPQPIDPEKSDMISCCSKLICFGCTYANMIREIEGRLLPKCPFCRTAVPDTDEEMNEQLMKRIEANDPVAMRYIGTERCEKGDYKSAFEYWTKAAALGDALAHYQLSCFYHEGKVVQKDKKKQRHHLTVAAIGGHPLARHNLGCMEGGNGRVDREVKHLIIAAKLGYDKSLERVKILYKGGFVRKEDLDAALRGYQAAIAATKSAQREEAAGFFNL